MLIRDRTWEVIRDKFSEREKEELRKSIIGEAICPAGYIIDIKKLDVALEFKLEQALSIYKAEKRYEGL